ncbi:hypothetical protein A2U01_0051350, partial [Trifolium medium]|nr:hypothetical protein [Trifolium medium]
MKWKVLGVAIVEWWSGGDIKRKPLLENGEDVVRR